MLAGEKEGRSSQKSGEGMAVGLEGRSRRSGGALLHPTVRQVHTFSIADLDRKINLPYGAPFK